MGWHQVKLGSVLHAPGGGLALCPGLDPAARWWKGERGKARPHPAPPPGVRGPGSWCGEVAGDASWLPRWDMRMPCLSTYYVLQLILQGRKHGDARGRVACPSSRSNWRCLDLNPSSWEKTRLFQNNQGHSL